MNPCAPADAAPPLAQALLAHVAADWPEFAELRPAASAWSHKQRLPQAVSIVVNELRVAFASALLCSAPSDGQTPDDDAARNAAEIARAIRLHGHARAIVCDGQDALAKWWHFTPGQCALVMSRAGLPRLEGRMRQC